MVPAGAGAFPGPWGRRQAGESGGRPPLLPALHEGSTAPVSQPRSPPPGQRLSPAPRGTGGPQWSPVHWVHVQGTWQTRVFTTPCTGHMGQSGV